MNRHPVRRPRRCAHGFTLVEVMVTTALLMAVLAIVLPLIDGSLNTFTAAQVRSDAVDNAQLALTQIGHDVISSNILYIDASGSQPVVHLETYGKAATSTCVEYQVTYPANPAPQVGLLQRRTKAPGTAVAWPAGWTSVMTGIVNTSQPAPLPMVFTTAGNGQSLVVNLWVLVDKRSIAAAAPENYTSTFTGPAIPANAAAIAPLNSEPC